MIIETDDYRAEFDDSLEARQKLFDRMVKFLVFHECFSGESFCQTDGAQIGMQELIPEITDEILKFNVDYK